MSHDEDADRGSPQREISVAMRFAEDHPSVPLHAVLTELRHAELAVPSDIVDRSEVMRLLVAARLGLDGDARSYDAPQPPAEERP